MASQAAAQPAASTTRTWTPLPAEFDGLARLAASACQAPWPRSCSPVREKAWSGSGTAPPRTVLPSQDPFYEYTSGRRRCSMCPTHKLDKRFCATDCVKGRLAVRSYAGCALRSARRGGPGEQSASTEPPRASYPPNNGRRSRCWPAMRDANRTAGARGRTRAARFGAACDGAAARAPPSPRRLAAASPSLAGAAPRHRAGARADRKRAGRHLSRRRSEQNQLRQSGIPARVRIGPGAEHR